MYVFRFIQIFIGSMSPFSLWIEACAYTKRKPGFNFTEFHLRDEIFDGIFDICSFCLYQKAFRIRIIGIDAALALVVARFIFHWHHRLYGNDWFEYMNVCNMRSHPTDIYWICNIRLAFHWFHCLCSVRCYLHILIDCSIIFFHFSHPYLHMISIRICSSIFCLINEFTISIKV